jgi:hypothetical protein
MKLEIMKLEIRIYFPAEVLLLLEQRSSIPVGLMYMNRTLMGQTQWQLHGDFAFNSFYGLMFGRYPTGSFIERGAERLIGSWFFAPGLGDISLVPCVRHWVCHWRAILGPYN